MSFAQEMKDFLAAYQVVDDMGQKREDRKLKKEEMDNDKAYKEALIDIQRQELALKQQVASSRAGRGAGGNGSRGNGSRGNGSRGNTSGGGTDGGQPDPSTSGGRAQIRLQMEQDEAAQKQKDREAGIYADSLPPTGGDGEEYIPPAEDLSELPEYADGGLVGDGKPTAIPTTPAPAPAAPTPAPSAPTPAAPTPAAPTPAPAPATPTPTLSATSAGNGRVSAPAPPTAKPTAIPEDSEKPLVGVQAEATGNGKNPKQSKSEILMRPVENSLQSIGERFIVDLGKGRTGTEGAAVEPLPEADFKKIIEVAAAGEGPIPKHMETMVALAEAWQAKISPEQREKLAYGILKTSMQQSQTLAALGEEALRNGDTETFCKFLGDACDRFPTGHRFDIQPDPKYGFTYTISDLDGEIVQKGAVPVDKAWEMTKQVKDGSLFLKNVYQYAKGAEAKRKAPDTYGRAIDDVTEAYSATAAAIEALDVAKTTDGGDVTAAEKKVADTRAALTAAEEKARKAGKAAGAKDVSGDIRSARKADPVMAIPDGSPAPDATAATKPTAAGKPAAVLKPLDKTQIAKVKARLDNGADPEAMKKTLTEAGYSTEGLFDGAD